MAESAVPVARALPVAIRIAEPLPTVHAIITVAPRRGVVRTFAAGVGWLFGLACAVVGLAILAAIPVVNLLALGYLLEAGGRVAKSGRIRDGFIGIRTAGRVGGMVAFAWLFLLPVRFVADYAADADILAPGGRVAEQWRTGLLILTGVTFVHVLAAVARGGRLRDFANPFAALLLLLRLFRGGFYAEARDRVWDTVVGLRLQHYFWLGLRGFAVGFAWLAVPVTLLAVGHGKGPAPLLGVLGAILLAVVMVYLPFLQLRVATRGRFAAGFDVRGVRADFRNAPVAHAFALFVTVLFAVPLYLLKIEVVPREAAWLPALVFLAFIYPARLLVGWAVGRAQRRETSRHWTFRWAARLSLPAVALAYVGVVFLAQYTSWNGIWGLYEQHAVLLPVPY